MQTDLIKREFVSNLNLSPKYSIYAAAPKGEWQPAPVTPAELEWDSSAQPRSLVFDDIYFSRGGGRDETRHVFLSGNALPGRWIEPRQNRQPFAIGEFGFGTGLNFLVTWEAWKASQPEGARLHYLSFEKHPLARSDMERAHSAWPGLSDLSARLRSALPEAVPGMHRLCLDDSSLELTLVYGAIEEFLPLVHGRFDAWYFDGFDPRKNPELWRVELFRIAGRLSAAGATFATYSSARIVRDNLAQAGWNGEKCKGFGTKREMLRGIWPGPAMTASAPRASRRALVIGAGLAGCAAGYSLTRRGWDVTLIDKSSAPAQGASGNAGAVLMPHLSVKYDFLSRFALAGYFYTLQVLRELLPTSKLCGVLRLTTNMRLEALYDRLADLALPKTVVEAAGIDAASRIAGVAVKQHALFFPQGGYLEPAALCAALIKAGGKRLKTVCDTSLEKLSLDGDLWSAYDRAGEKIAEGDAVVLANAFAASKILDLEWLPLEAVRGQVQFVSPAPALRALKTALCYDGFVTPAGEAGHFMGATYEHGNFSETADPQKQKELLLRLARWVEHLDPAELKADSPRVAFRTMSPDRMPLIGAAPNIKEFEAAYLAANGGQFGSLFPEGAGYPGLYLSVGHGSRGLSSCPLAGEIIASAVEGEPAPIESDLLRAIDPMRFPFRAVRRGEAVV